MDCILMHRLIRNAWPFVVFMSLNLLIPISSWADQYYPFLKVDCNKSTQTMIVSTYHIQQSDNPEKMQIDVKNGKIKDVYDLSDIAKEPKRKIHCHLGDGQDVSFKGWYDGSHMANDSLSFDLNGVGIGSFMPSQYDKIIILVISKHEAVSQSCKMNFWNNDTENGSCSEMEWVKDGKEINESAN